MPNPELEGSLDAYRAHAAAHAAAFDGVITDQLQWLLTRTTAGDMVVDVGCGTGRDVKLLRSLERVAIGIDLVPQMLVGLAGVAVCDARVMPFEDQSFDAVYSSAGLVHLDPDAFADAVTEMCRVAKPGAALTLSVRHRGRHHDDNGWESSPFGDRWYQRWNAEVLAETCHRSGVAIEGVSIQDDATRPGIAWATVWGYVLPQRPSRSA
jgi:SAM-dependent methyltransferase